MNQPIEAITNERKAWRWKRPVLILAVMAVACLSIAKAAFAQTNVLPGFGDVGVVGVLLEKGSFAAIAIYLIYSQTKTQQASLDAIEKTLGELTVVIKQLKWHIERQSGNEM